MFVLLSTHKKVLAELEEKNRKLLMINALCSQYKNEYTKLIKNWNSLVGKVNVRGGIEFLNVFKEPTNTEFTQTEIEELIRLCHPDKHNGKESADRLTQKLLLMREK